MKDELPVWRLEPGIMLRPWGGKKLGELFNVPLSEEERVGETWNISIHPDAPSLWKNHPLSQQIKPEQMPYLVKLIDTADNLSVQVHPNDYFAKKFENTQGKSECWLILESGKESGIHLGLKPGVSQKFFEQALLKGNDVSDYLNFKNITSGDFFYVPPGTFHSIGKDVFLVEVQQSSGITYRVWDWNRRDRQGHPRELHIDKAMQVANFDKKNNSQSCFKIKQNLFQFQGLTQLLQHPQFHLTLYNLNQGNTHTLKPNKNGRISSLLVLKGEGILKNSYQTIDISSYQSYILREEVTVESNTSLNFIFIC